MGSEGVGYVGVGGGCGGVFIEEIASVNVLW